MIHAENADMIEWLTGKYKTLQIFEVADIECLHRQT